MYEGAQGPRGGELNEPSRAKDVLRLLAELLCHNTVVPPFNLMRAASKQGSADDTSTGGSRRDSRSKRNVASCENCPAPPPLAHDTAPGARARARGRENHHSGPRDSEQSSHAPC